MSFEAPHHLKHLHVFCVGWLLRPATEMVAIFHRYWLLSRKVVVPQSLLSDRNDTRNANLTQHADSETKQRRGCYCHCSIHLSIRSSTGFGRVSGGTFNAALDLETRQDLLSVQEERIWWISR